MKKRIKKIKKKINLKKKHHIEKAISFLKKSSTVKFIEKIDIAIKLGIDTKKSDQNIKNTVLLPNKIKKKIKIAVFSYEKLTKKMKDNSVVAIGMENLVEKIKKEKKANFDVVIAIPEAMKIIGKIGPILGPKGLMPNPKFGTITTNIEETLKKINKGQTQYKNDKYGIVHLSVGTTKFSTNQIKQNILFLLNNIKKVKPPQSKGPFLKEIFINSTMGVGIKIKKTSLNIKNN